MHLASSDLLLLWYMTLLRANLSALVLDHLVLPGLAPSELSMSLQPEEATLLHPGDWWSGWLAARHQVSGCLPGLWHETVMQQEPPDETARVWLELALAWGILAVAGGLLAC